MDHEEAEQVAGEHAAGEPVGAVRPDAEPEVTTPGDALRSLPAEAHERGTRFVSAQAMQARLFSVYDASAAAEDALSLVQKELTLTLDRSYYDAEEIEAMAAQLDSLLRLDSIDLTESTLVSEE
jgi:hypothetical protein